MKIMKRDAFFMAYILCESLVRGPGYIDAMTDPKPDPRAGGENDAPDRQTSG